MERKDIFISYKNDSAGNQLAYRLSQDLEKLGYSVYFNSNEKRGHNFPERLKTAIENCKDFMLILSKGCLEQLKRQEPVDWIREEILLAKKLGKHIIPIMMDDVLVFPNEEEMPEELKFLLYIDAIKLPEQYLKSPFSILLETVEAKPDGNDKYRDMFNSNPLYDVNEDFQQKLSEAKAGNIEAMYEVGMMYFYGVTTSEGTEARWDFENAAYWLKKVSESDSELRFHANNTIALMYYRGLMPRESQSYEKSFQYHKMSSLENKQSVNRQAFMRRMGLGCEFDYQEIVDYYKENIKIIEEDFAILELAEFMNRYGRFKEAFELYELISLVSPEAEYQIGMMYKTGVIYDPPKPDYIQAAYYFRNAADKNYILAAYEYGNLCLRPTGRFRKNFYNAEKYLKIAADKGHAGAQYLLGYMYMNGHVTKSLETAVEYYEKAREQGYTYATVDLSKLYQQPECKNYQKALECAKIAASHGVAEGELIMGNLLFFGRGCEADINKAYEMYSRAYKHGMYYALVMMKKIEKIKGINKE